MNLERQTDAAAAAAAARAGARAWRVRDGLLNAHLYGGLVCCWYLLIYGVTSLAFNHPWLLPETKGALVTWEQPIALPAFEDPVKFGEAVRDELDLIGWVIPWNMRRDDKGDLHFELSRPGKKYFVVTDRAAGMARVEERGTGLRSALGFLHGSTEGVPGSTFLGYWGWYTEVTNWLVLFFVGSGVYLWARRASDRRWVLAVLGAGLGLSVALMSYLYFVG